MDKESKNLISELTLELLKSSHDFFNAKFANDDSMVQLGAHLNIILNGYMTAMLDQLLRISELEPNLNVRVRKFSGDLINFLEKEGLADKGTLQ